MKLGCLSGMESNAHILSKLLAHLSLIARDHTTAASNRQGCGMRVCR